MKEERPSIVLLTRENGPRVMFPVFDMIEHLVRNSKCNDSSIIRHSPCNCPSLIKQVKKDLTEMRCKDFVLRIDAPQSIQDALMGMDTNAFPSKTAGARSMIIYAIEYAVSEAQRRIEED